MNEVRHLKKCLRENIKEIASNTLKNKSDIESLIRFCGWVHNDANQLLVEWRAKEKT